MSVFYSDESITLHHGDAIEVTKTLPPGTVDCVVTSPPYFGLRDYGVEGQYGSEADPLGYIQHMVELFDEIKRVLAPDGTVWLNIGDSYAMRPGGFGGDPKHKKDTAFQRVSSGDRPAKNALLIPWRVALALQDAGWILRNSIIWAKPNAMPESVTDRLSQKYEPMFMLTKSTSYYFDLPAVMERAVGQVEPRNAPGSDLGVVDVEPVSSVAGEVLRNPGDVWAIPTAPFRGAHTAPMPPKLALRCIQAGCKPGGVVLDPFNGSGTSGFVATRTGRRYIGIDISEEYLRLSLDTRLAQRSFLDDLEDVS